VKKNASNESIGPVLIIGSSGQVAQALDLRGFGNVPHVSAGRDVADIADIAALSRLFAVYNPRLVVNAAAYTAVDKAEGERELAFAVNRDGAANLARLCFEASIPLVHISTDYVFDGNKPAPYVEDDLVAPVNVYGMSKSAGEEIIRAELREHVILRTSWVYSAVGSNFLKTMLRLAESRDSLTIVDDQYGAPTYAADIAEAIGVIVGRLLDAGTDYGTFHFTNGGSTSWCGFAREIFSQATAYGIAAPSVAAIPASAYPTPARRPANSRLDCSKIKAAYGIVPAEWKQGLERCLADLMEETGRVKVS
jgi:dTDP-4-dehydrorhamnose reductase